MDKESVGWKGPFTAIVTPFDAKGRLDEEGYARNVEFLIEKGVAGIVANGCTGEFWAQSMAERKRVMEIAVKAARGRIWVIGGSGAITAPDAIELTKAAKDAGCDGAMVIPPYFVKPSTDDVIAYYQAISDAVPMPIMLYNLPSQSFNLTPEIVNRLCDIDQIVAIKDSSFDFNNFYRMQVLCGHRLRILIGPSTMFGYAALRCGALGWVDTYSNVWPELTVGLYRAIVAGDDAKALEAQAIGCQYRAFMDSVGNMYCTTKAAMNLRGLAGGAPRSPLRPHGRDAIERIRKGLEGFGLALARAAE